MKDNTFFLGKVDCYRNSFTKRLTVVIIIQIIAFKTYKWYNLRMYVRKHNDFFIMDCKIQVDELQNNIIKSIKREFIMKN